MTTISTYLAASLVAVTFGWVPSERAGESQPAEGYDYLVKLSPEDLEAMRDGRAVDLVSELPDDVGPIERVRVYVGEGEAPRQLRDRDRLSPQRIFAESRAKRYEVKKPVTPEWKDAALLEADDANVGETAERRTAYQNPPTLQDGFAEATRPLAEVGQAIDSQTRNLADGTARLFEQSGDQLRRGAESLLNGAGETLERIVPNNTTTPYASRPQYDEPSRLAAPDTSTGADAPQQAQFTTPPYSNQQPRNPSESYPPQNYPAQTSPQSNASNPPRDDFGSPSRVNSYDRNSRDDLVQRFTDDPYAATSRSVLTPVQRRESAAESDNSASAPSSSQSNVWDPNYNASNDPSRSQAGTSQGAQRDGSAFADLQPRANSGPNTPPPRSSFYDDDFAASRPPANTTSNTGGAEANNTPSTGWTGREFADPGAAADPSTVVVNERSDSSVVIDRLLMLILGGATCFTWIAYIDVRNKYLSVLRAAPGSGYSNAA